LVFAGDDALSQIEPMAARATTHPSSVSAPGAEKGEVASDASRSRRAVARDSAAPSPSHHSIRFDEARVDPDAIRVVRRLTQAGFEAYLVGGAVRDLLVGRRAKDFDIATSARPEDVKRVFRGNCRIIGRRFRLAHVFFGYGGRTYEVATFRKNPIGVDDAVDGESDLLIRSDNVFGAAHEDAERRDFTINALFYDHDRGEILDWASGMGDIERRVVRTIGDPDVRFREDPVRILRAIKFAARLDFGMDPDVYDAIVAHRDELERAARPRVFEEILRLLRGGAARRSIYLAWDTGALAVVLPELSTYLDDADLEGGTSRRVFRALAAIDELTAERGAALDDLVLLAALLREPIREWCEGARTRDEWRQAIEEKISEIGERMAITRRTAEGLARIYAAEARLRAGRTGGFLATPLGPLARDLALVTLAADGAAAEAIAHVRKLPMPEPAAPPREERQERGGERHHGRAGRTRF
jgi:poly(A) polymerase